MIIVEWRHKTGVLYFCANEVEFFDVDPETGVGSVFVCRNMWRALRIADGYVKVLGENGTHLGIYKFDDGPEQIMDCLKVEPRPHS